MPRRPAQVNQADVQRIIRACQREKVPFRITLQPHGAAVFESAPVLAPAAAEVDSLDRELEEFAARHGQV
jgi:hypothetical protein